MHGHQLGDELHEYLAPCIYEGEGEMLGMAFFKSLVKDHGKRFFEPVGKALQQAGLKTLNPMNPMQVWKLRGALVPYAKWMAKESVIPKGSSPLPEMPAVLKRHAKFAVANLQRTGLEVSSVMRKHQLKLADRQCRMAELSQRAQNLVTILVTALHARNKPEVVVNAADVMCEELTLDYTGRRPSDKDLKNLTQLGAQIAEHGFDDLTANVAENDILMPYK